MDGGCIAAQEAGNTVWQEAGGRSEQARPYPGEGIVKRRQPRLCMDFVRDCTPLA
jgi:hypothetical protein